MRGKQSGYIKNNKYFKYGKSILPTAPIIKLATRQRTTIMPKPMNERDNFRIYGLSKKPIVKTPVETSIESLKTSIEPPIDIGLPSDIKLPTDNKNNDLYSIGITTYSYRYKKYLIDLISDIRKDNQNEIILGINGNYKENFDSLYRRNVLELSIKYDDVFPFIYPNFRSLSKIWNTIVINSSNEYVLLLNDDTTITDFAFWNVIKENIIKYQTSFTINTTYSHFIIKKSELEEVGWFDERFLGIGFEDHEFKGRYKEYFNKEILNIEGIPEIKTYFDDENALINQKKANRKYSRFNEFVYYKKLSPIQQYPYEKFYRNNRDKL